MWKAGHINALFKLYLYYYKLNFTKKNHKTSQKYIIEHHIYIN